MMKITPTQKLELKYPNATFFIGLARCSFNSTESSNDTSKDDMILKLSRKALLERVLQHSNAGRWDTVELIEAAYGIKLEANKIKIKE